MHYLEPQNQNPALLSSIRLSLHNIEVPKSQHYDLLTQLEMILKNARTIINDQDTIRFKGIKYECNDISSRTITTNRTYRGNPIILSLVPDSKFQLTDISFANTRFRFNDESGSIENIPAENLHKVLGRYLGTIIHRNRMVIMNGAFETGSDLRSLEPTSLLIRTLELAEQIHLHPQGKTIDSIIRSQDEFEYFACRIALWLCNKISLQHRYESEMLSKLANELTLPEFVNIASYDENCKKVYISPRQNCFLKLVFKNITDDIISELYLRTENTVPALEDIELGLENKQSMIWGLRDESKNLVIARPFSEFWGSEASKIFVQPK